MRNASDLRHVDPGGVRCLLRSAAMLARVHVRGVPIPPVVGRVSLLVVVMVVGCLMQKLCQSGNVYDAPPSSSRVFQRHRVGRWRASGGSPGGVVQGSALAGAITGREDAS